MKSNIAFDSTNSEQFNEKTNFSSNVALINSLFEFICKILIAYLNENLNEKETTITLIKFDVFV